MKCFIISCLLACTTLSLSAQGLIRVEVTDFKEKNDSLYVDYSVRIGAQSIETGQMLQIRPVVESGDQFEFLPEVTILGKNKAKTLSRFVRVGDASYVPASICGDTVLNYSLQLPYELWMDSASLVLQQELTDYRNHTTLITYKLKDHIELSAREPYQVSPVIAYVIPEKEVKIRKRQGKAYLDFQVGRSVILPNYRRNPEELQKINEVIQEVISNPDAGLKGLYIEGYASPEGTYAANERLSAQRAQALKEYIRTKFNIGEDFFKVSSVAEDWDGLVEMVKASNMPQKDRVLEIISTIGIFDGREVTLMKLDRGNPYRYMLKEMFPELRRVEYQIDYTVKDYDVKETLLLLEQKPGDLSQLELYNLAQTYQPGSKEYNKILLEVIPCHFSEEETANANAAAILIQNGELSGAKRLLDKAGNCPAVLNNRGIVLMLEGELDQAEAYFKQALADGIEGAESNLKEVQTKREDNRKQARYQKNK